MSQTAFHKNANLIVDFMISQKEFISGNFDKNKMDQLTKNITQMAEKKDKIIAAFSYFQ